MLSLSALVGSEVSQRHNSNMPLLPIRRAALGDLVDAASLLNNALGIRTSSQELARIQGHLVAEIFVLPYSPTAAELLLGRYPRIVGVAVVGHGLPSHFAGLLPPNARPSFPERFAHLHYLALDPRVRRQGNSSVLIVHAVRWALAHQYRALVAASWFSGRSQSSGDLMVAAGAVAVGDAPMAKLLPKRDCPGCGENCHCAAIVYLRSIDEETLKQWAGARRQQRRKK